MTGIVVYRGCYFGLFDTGKAMLGADSKKTNLLAMWAMAQCTTITAGVMSYPFDTVRKRLQMDSGRSEKHYTGTIDCIKKTLAKEGIRGLYRAVHV